MTTFDVTNEPLAFQITFYPLTLNANATSNSQYLFHTLSFQQAEALLPAPIADGVAALMPYLGLPLGMIFSRQWASMKAAQITNAQTYVQKQAAAAGYSISNVVATFPDVGIVTAMTQPALGPDRPGSLNLYFHLTGCSISFDYLLPSANWQDSFDITVSIYTPVPELPFGFAPEAIAYGSNAQLDPNNMVADALALGDDFFTSIGNFLSGGGYVSDFDAAAATIEQETDEIVPFGGANPLSGLLTALNGVSPDVAALGFTHFKFSIEHITAMAGTLTGTLTHPLDPGPVVKFADDPFGPFQPSGAQLTADQTTVPPGGSVIVAGQHFPWASSTQAALRWENTTSGTAVESQLHDSGPGLSMTDTVQAGSSFDGTYTHTVSGLTPSTTYTFTARCADAVSWSLWSDPFTVRTTVTDDVELYLSAPAGSTLTRQILATAALSTDSSDWICPTTIPTTTPPGIYVLAAVLSGQTLATLDLNVGTIQPNLAVINASTNQILDNPVVASDQPVTVRGEYFPDGPVAVTIDGQPVTSTTAIAGSFRVTITAPRAYSTGATYTVQAIGGTAIATTTFQEYGIAQ